MLSALEWLYCLLFKGLKNVLKHLASDPFFHCWMGSAVGGDQWVRNKYVTWTDLANLTFW